MLNEFDFVKINQLDFYLYKILELTVNKDYIKLNKV